MQVVPGQVSLLHHSALNSSAFQWFGFSSSASAQPSEKETAQTGNEQEDKAEGTPADQTEEFVSDEKNKSGFNMKPLAHFRLSKVEVLNKLYFLILIQICKVTKQEMTW